MTKVTGDTVNSTGTWTYNSTFAGMYEYTLSPFIAGQPDGIAHAMDFRRSRPLRGFPERFVRKLANGWLHHRLRGNQLLKSTIEQPAGSNLADGTDEEELRHRENRPEQCGQDVSRSRTPAAPALTKLAIKKSGTHKNDFVIGPLARPA